MELGGEQAVFAYLFSLSSVRYMIDSYGMYRVEGVLEELASGADIGKAINNIIMLSYQNHRRKPLALAMGMNGGNFYG